MILSDQDIKQFISEGQVSVTPLSRTTIEPASIDLTLANHFLLPISPKDNVQSLKDPIQGSVAKLKNKCLISILK